MFPLSSRLTLCKGQFSCLLAEPRLSGALSAKLTTVYSEKHIFRELFVEPSDYTQKVRSGQVSVFIGSNEKIGDAVLIPLHSKLFQRIKLAQRTDIVSKRVQQDEHTVVSGSSKKVVSEVELELVNASSSDETIEIREVIGENNKTVYDKDSLSPWPTALYANSDASRRFAFKTIVAKASSSIQLAHNIVTPLF